MTFTGCPDCGGTRVNDVGPSSKIDGIDIAEGCGMQIGDLAVGAWPRRAVEVLRASPVGR